MDVAVHHLDFSPFFVDTFQYPVPRPVLEGWAAGTGFPNATGYSPEEMELVAQDIHDLATKILESNGREVCREIIVTAGAPGAGKTTLVEAVRSDIPAPYVDPDAVVLKEGLPRTYGRDIARDPSVEGRTAAYHKWRPASNAGTHFIVARLVQHGSPFYFGSTSSSPQTADFFAFLRRQGYRMDVLHVSASPEVRFASITQRDQAFVQTTEAEVKSKGDLVPQRLSDTYLRFAENVAFFHRAGAQEPPVAAARWHRSDTEGVPSTLTVIDQAAYDAVVGIHNEVAERLGLPSWEESLSGATLVPAAIEVDEGSSAVEEGSAKH